MAQCDCGRRAARTRRRTGRSARSAGTARATPYLFLAPYLVLFLLSCIGPAIFGFWMSLHDWDFQLPGKPFVGLQNYKDLFDPLSEQPSRSGTACGRPAIFTVARCRSWWVAARARRAAEPRFPGRTFFRAVYFAPYVLGVAVVGLMFRYILDTSFGIVNAFLGLFGISEIGWTTEQPWAFVALVAMTVWWTSASTRSSTSPGCRTSRPSSTRRPAGRGERVAEVPQRDPAGAAAGHHLHRDHHAPGLREHVRPVGC